MRSQCGKQRKRFAGSKLILMSLALALIFCGIIGGTVAWLIADTKPVVNTFTYGDINIALAETDVDGDGDATVNKYSMIPGSSIEKDPKVTVLAGSEASWLFVKLEKSENFDDFITYEIADGWIPLENVPGVYYRAVDKSDSNAEFGVLKDNIINVKGEVTKEMLNALDKNGANGYPTLTVTAYAVQRDNNITTAADAWAKIPAVTNP